MSTSDPGTAREAMPQPQQPIAPEAADPSAGSPKAEPSGPRWTWGRRLVADFRADHPTHQVAVIYYVLAILAVAGSALGGAWSLGKHFWSDKATQGPELALIRAALARDSSPEDARRAADRIQELVAGLMDLRGRQPKLAADIDDAFRDLGAGKTAKSEALLRRQIERSAGDDRKAREQRAEFQRYLASMVFVHNKAEALRELQEAVVTDPDSFIAWYDLGSVALQTGPSTEAERAFREALRLARLHADDSQELASLLGFGAALVQRGNRPAALMSYQRAVRLIDQGLLRDPANTKSQSDRAGVLHTVGEILTAQGDRDGALKAHQDALSIRGKLVERDPSNAPWQYDLSSSYGRVGDFLWHSGDDAGALKAYRDGFAVTEKLANRDPSNMQWQHQLFLRYSNIGDVLREEFNKNHSDFITSSKRSLVIAVSAYKNALGIIARLAEQEPSNTQWQLELASGYNKYGDGLSDYGEIGDAREAYRDALVITRRLVALDPSNLEWQHDLFVTYQNIARSGTKSGNSEEAMINYEESRRIAQRVVERDPANESWRRALADTHHLIGNVLSGKADRQAALANYSEAIRLTPDNLSVRKKRGLTFFVVGNHSAAASDLEQVVQQRPDDAYAVLWLNLARARARNASVTGQLATDAKKLNSAEWPYPIVEVLLGDRSPETILASANGDQRCSAQFFIGEWQSLRGRRAAAIAALKEATLDYGCPPRSFESDGAAAALKRLER